MYIDTKKYKSSSNLNNYIATGKKHKDTSIKGMKKVGKKFKKKLKKYATKAELSVQVILNNLKVKYNFQHQVMLDNKFYIVDFYLPYKNTILEIDGEYHDSEEQQAKDDIRQAALEEIGYKVIRINNKEVGNFSFETLL